jgi:hypothetical protein
MVDNTFATAYYPLNPPDIRTENRTFTTESIPMTGTNGTAATLEASAPFASATASIVGELTTVNTRIAGSNDPAEIRALATQRDALQGALIALKTAPAQPMEPAQSEEKTEPTEEDISTYHLALQGLLGDLDRQLETADARVITTVAWKRRALMYLIDYCYPPKEEPQNLIPGVSDITCKASPRGMKDDTSEGVNFSWRMSIKSRRGDKNADDQRTCQIDVYLIRNDKMEWHRKYGTFAYSQQSPLGKDYTVVCDMNYDGASEPGDDPDPTNRAILKPFRESLLQWLEGRGDIGHSEVCTSVNGDTQMKFELLSADIPDDENDHPVLELRLERNCW